MEIQNARTKHVPALDEAARLADLIEEGNELLKKAKEVACRQRVPFCAASRMRPFLSPGGFLENRW